MDGWKIGRAKISIKWIPKDTSRNVTFMKRKKGLRKKVEELSILCGVEACMVCLGPQTDQHGSHDLICDVWPNMSKASEVIERYRRLPKEEQDKKKLDNSTFLERRIKKLKIELTMKRKENGELEMDTMYPSWDNCLNYSNVDNLRYLLDYIDTKLEDVQDRINYVTIQENKISHADVRNTVVPLPEMESIRQPLMELYNPTTSQIMLHNGLMPMPYQSQDNLSFTMGDSHPDPNLEGIRYMNPYVSSTMDYHSKINPIVFTPLKDYHYTADAWAFGTNEGTDKTQVQMAAIDNIHHDNNFFDLDNKFFDENSQPMANKNSIFYDHLHSNNCMLGGCLAQLFPCCIVYSPCPKHYAMASQGSHNVAIQDFQVSSEPQQQQQQLLNTLMELRSVYPKYEGGEGTKFAKSSLGASSRMEEENCKHKFLQ